MGKHKDRGKTDTKFQQGTVLQTTEWHENKTLGHGEPDSSIDGVEITTSETQQGMELLK